MSCLNWPANGSRRWKRIPTLIRHNPKAVSRILGIGIAIAAITIAVTDLALLHEMSGLLSVNPLNVYLVIAGFSFLIGGAVLFYPFLLVNHRLQVYVDEEAEKLNAKYRAGMQRFQKERANRQNEPESNILNDMSKDADCQDFVYLYLTVQEIEGQEKDEIKRRIEEKIQTYTEAQREILRELICVTSWENLEDSAYNIGSYIMPVTYCMASIALGFITFALIPLLGTSKVIFGGFEVNLLWAVGGFIGAYLYSFLPFFQRCNRRDLPPRAFLHYALNIFLGTLGIALLGNLFLGSISSNAATQLALAAALGSIPFYVLAVTRRRGIKTLDLADTTFAKKLGIERKKTGSQTGRQDLCSIPGIEYDYAERLREEGIMNIQNLAFANVEDLSKRTRLNRRMLFDWKDQAILMLLTGDIKLDHLKKGALESDRNPT